MITRAEFLKLAASVPLLAGEQPPFTPEAMKQRQDAWEEAVRPPITRVIKDPTLTLYSSAVNSITGWAEVGPVTWLGTSLGVKRVEKGHPTRHYTQKDGLPGGRITAITADSEGVVVLLDNNQGEECLCYLESKSEQWKVLGRWYLPTLREYGPTFTGWIARNAKVIIASPRVVATRAPEPLFCFDRELGQRRSLPWDTAIRSDHQRLVVSFLQCREKTVLVGTNAGLMELPLSADGGPWKRYLASYSITWGAAGPKAMYLWLTKRAPGAIVENLESTGTLHYVDTTRWEAQLLPPTNIPEQRMAAVDEQGSLWIVRPAPTAGISPIFFGGQNFGDFYCWKPGAKDWQVFRADGSDGAQSAPTPQQYNPFTLPVIAKADVIPDAAARLATLDRGQIAYFNIVQLSSFGSVPEPSMALQWMRTRFPHWLSPDASQELKTIPEIQNNLYCFALHQPGKPSTAWTGVPGALQAVDPSQLPAKVMPPEGKPYIAPWRPSLPELTVQQQAILPETTLSLHASLKKMLPLESGRWLVFGARPFLVDKSGTRWQELTLPPNSNMGGQVRELFGTDEVFVLGPKKEVFATCWDMPVLLRMDPRTGKFLPTEVTRPKNAQFVGTDANGAWWRDYDGSFHRLMPDGKTWQQHRLPEQKGFQPEQEVKLAASRLWQRGYENGQRVVRGWSPETNVWSASVAVDNLSSLREESPGSCVALARQNSRQQLITYRWEAKTDRWVAQEPFVVKLPDSELMLLEVDSKAIWLSTAQALHRWERATDTLQTFPLPTLDRLDSNNDQALRVEKDAFFRLSSSGLWRLDRKTHTWTEWTIPVSAKQITPRVVVSDTENIWGALEALSSAGTSLFRFAPKTKTFTILDKKAGVPADGNGRLASDGVTAWILHPSGAYRFDSVSQRFVLIVPGNPIALARSSGRTWITISPQKFEEPTLWSRNDSDGKVEAEEQSKQKRSGVLLATPSGLLVSTHIGLFLLPQPGSWKRINTWGVAPITLHLSGDNRVWVSGPEGLVHLQLQANTI